MVQVKRKDKPIPDKKTDEKISWLFIHQKKNLGKMMNNIGCAFDNEVCAGFRESICSGITREDPDS